MHCVHVVGPGCYITPEIGSIALPDAFAITVKQLCVAVPHKIVMVPLGLGHCIQTSVKGKALDENEICPAHMHDNSRALSPTTRTINLHPLTPSPPSSSGSGLTTHPPVPPNMASFSRIASSQHCQFKHAICVPLCHCIHGLRLDEVTRSPSG